MNDAALLARHALELMDEGKLDEWEETMQPDCAFTGPGSTLHGRRAIREFVEGFKQAFPDVRHTLDSVYAAGDTVIVEVTLTATHAGPLRSPAGEIPPTGRSIRLAEAQVIELRDGKAASMRTYFDRMDMLAQLGLMSSASPAEEHNAAA
jgi:predicted ester cyclase